MCEDIRESRTKTRFKSYTKNEETRDKLIEEINCHLTFIHGQIGPEKFSAEQLNNYRNTIYDKGKLLNISDATINFVYKLIFSLEFGYSPQNYIVTWKKILNLFKLFSLHLTDIFATSILIYIYFEEKHWFVFSITLSLTLINSGLVAQVMSNRKRKSPVLHYVSVIFNLYPIYSITYALQLAWKLKQKTTMDPEVAFTNLENECGHIERIKYTGFFKYVPFIIIQLNLLDLDYYRNYYKVVQLVPFGTSLLGTLLAVFSRFKAPDLSNLWVISVLAARLCCIILIASTYPVFTVIALICHWFLETIWYLFKVLHRPEYCMIEKIIFSVNEGVICTFVPVHFLNLKLNIFLFIIHFFENLVVIIVWYLQENVTASNYFLPYIVVMNIVYYLLGLICYIKFKERDNEDEISIN